MERLRYRRTGKLTAIALGLVAALGHALGQEAIPTVAPLEIIHGKPFVMVMVNGKGPYRFVIDTGTGGEAFVSAELAAELSLPETGKITLNDPSGRGGQKVPMVMLGSLRVANVTFLAVKAAVHNLTSGDGPCQGLLGFALFRDYLLTLDFPHRRMSLSTGGLRGDGEHAVLPFRMPDGIPVIKLTAGGVQIEAQLDSGGSGLSMPLQKTSGLRFSSRYASLSNAHSLSTQFMMMGANLSGNVRLGAYTFKHPFIEINPAFPLANFGSCPMQQFALTFDQKNGLVMLLAQRKTFHLSATPTPMRLQGTPDSEAKDPRLVPLG